MAAFHNFCVCMFFSERPLEEPGWGRLELTVVILVPSCLLCVGVLLLGVFAVQGQRCAYNRAHKQDAEEPLDDQMLTSPNKCLKDLIYDMSTSGSGSGKRETIADVMTQSLDHLSISPICVQFSENGGEASFYK